MPHALQVDTSYKQILKIALPISLALFVPQLNLVINTIFLGHLSEQALAAASITGVYYVIFGGLGYGLNNGLQALISRRAGEGKPKEIGTIFQHGLLIAIGISLFGIAFTYLVAPFFFKATIQSAAIHQMTVSFLFIRILGLPFLYVYQMRNALLVGINRSKLLIIGTAAEALANVVFDYGFIYGKLGLPKLGFNGAAVASIIAEFTGMFVIFLVVQANGINRQFDLFARFNFSRRLAIKIFQLSGPLIFQMAISVVSWFYFFILVEHLGQTQLAISTTMRTVFGFFGVFNWAFSSAANSMVSNIIGQGKKEEVVQLVAKIMVLSASISATIAIGLLVWPEFYFSLFGQDLSFAQEGTPVLRIVALALILMSLSTVWLNAITGTGKSNITFFVELVAIVVYCLYAYFVLAVLNLPISWGWSSEIVYWTLMGSLSYLYIRRGRWKTKVI